jgi:hypothetical protein
VQLFNNIRYRIGNIYFKKELASLKRKKVTTNLLKAKYIGIVYIVESEKQYEAICSFVKSLQDERKEVKALGFVNDKMIPHFCYPKIAYDYFTVKDLNWYLKPSNTFVHDFLNKEFDLLLDLSIQSCFSVQYVAGLSKAKFKVGRFGINPLNFYDLMLQVDSKIKIEDYFRHIRHYLTILNSSENA